MLNGEKIVVVMPAYNAARTLRQTYEEVMAHGIVDHVIVVDDASHDDTVAIARTLDRVQVEVHPVQPGLRRESKDLLPPRACCRSRHYHHDRAFARGLLERLPWTPTPMTLFSTTKFWHKLSRQVARSGK
jgi:glycosyltransferase involved in cell wall biosynthesis